MRMLTCLSLIMILASITCGRQSDAVVGCVVHLERARSYEISNDKRAEQEFRSALRDGDERCIDGLVELSQHLARNLRFADAANTLQQYIAKTRLKNHEEDLREIDTFRYAAAIQKRLENSATPDLKDLIDFTKLANGYGRRKANDALPYAERAVDLYPSSVDSLMLLVDILMPMSTDNDRVELLLNRAVSIDTNNARVYSTRGWFYLFSRGQHADAEKEFQRALELDGENRTAWKGWGYVFMFKGQKKQALSAFKKYLSLRKPGESDTEITTLVDQLKENSLP